MGQGSSLWGKRQDYTRVAKGRPGRWFLPQSRFFRPDKASLWKSWPGESFLIGVEFFAFWIVGTCYTCASPCPTNHGARVWCGRSNGLVYCPDTQVVAVNHRTAQWLPSGSTNCISCKPHPFSWFLRVLFSACVRPFLPAWHSWVSHSGVTCFNGSYS